MDALEASRTAAAVQLRKVFFMSLSFKQVWIWDDE